MIAYKIMSGYNTHHREKDVWEKLKEQFEYLNETNYLIINEAKRLDLKNKYLDELNDEELVSYANMYKLIKPVESNDEDTPSYIIFFASGGGENRNIMESFHRAVCRLLLERMNLLDMELSIIVS